MSGSTTARITFDWGDGEHGFRLGLGQIRELQEKTGIGPAALLKRIALGDWKVDDLRETVRLGLVGAGTKAEEALKLVRRYVDERPLEESVEPAIKILNAVLFGLDDFAAGKAMAAETTGSTSPPSTDPEP